MIINTKQIQIESLLQFANKLGYKPRYDDILSRGFVIQDFTSWDTHYISCKDMIKLHNNTPNKIQVLGVTVYDTSDISYVSICPEFYDNAKNNKLVERVKLQPVGYCKNDYFREHFGFEYGLYYQNHLIKFTDKGKNNFKMLSEEFDKLLKTEK